MRDIEKRYKWIQTVWKIISSAMTIPQTTMMIFGSNWMELEDTSEKRIRPVCDCGVMIWFWDDITTF